MRYRTIQKDLEVLAGACPMDSTVMLFHAPPHDTALDLADLAGTTVEHVPVDPHVGSIAIRRFIDRRQPLVTLHGHIHEAARLSGTWRGRIGRTEIFGAAHDGPELAVVRFDLEDLASAERLLL
jgi:Icc-related predicted phosphoesterase